MKTCEICGYNSGKKNHSCALEFMGQLRRTKKESAKRIKKLESAIRYATDYLDDSKLNSIGAGSKAHNELLSALNN